MTPITTGQLLTIPQIADAQQRSRSSVWADVRTGRLKSMRFGRSVRIHPDDFEDFMAAAARNGSTDEDE